MVGFTDPPLLTFGIFTTVSPKPSDGLDGETSAPSTFHDGSVSVSTLGFAS
jgi:hypothetical protein